MKTLIIPDIHTDIGTSEMIIERESPDKTVFLGDYFDRFYDTPDIAYQVAVWLKESMAKNDRIHLLGNHDLGYSTINPMLKCSGYTKEKNMFVRKAEVDWNKLRCYHWVDDWLCTHAGLSNNFFQQYRSGMNIHEFLKIADTDYKRRDEISYNHKMFQAGTARGGVEDFGGIIWCDYSEFNDIPNIKQIFGHTPDDAVRHLTQKTSEHMCLDTGLGNYAIYNGKKMEIRKV